MANLFKIFKAGLWHLSRKNPNVQLVPIYLENLNRVLPKGSHLVVPVICSAIFGAPIASTHENESKQEFLIRAKKCIRGVTQWNVLIMKSSGYLSDSSLS